MNGKQRLEKFILTYPCDYIKTSEIARWGGTSGYSNRCCRSARILANEGFLERLSREEAILMGFSAVEGVYRIIRQPNKPMIPCGNLFRETTLVHL